jgi:hypothetical protein
MSNILKFPDKFRKEARRYRIPLYTDADIEIVLFCVNAFGVTPNRNMIDDLLAMDPIEVIECLDIASQSDIISNVAKNHIRCIRESIEES